MAFMNSEGINVSYDCSVYIKELEYDINTYGGDKFVYVFTEERQGVTIYKDYVLDNIEKSSSPINLSEVKECVRMTASALMELYKIENSVI